MRAALLLLDRLRADGRPIPPVVLPTTRDDAYIIQTGKIAEKLRPDMHTSSEAQNSVQRIAAAVDDILRESEDAYLAMPRAGDGEHDVVAATDISGDEQDFDERESVATDDDDDDEFDFSTPARQSTGRPSRAITGPLAT